jgi:tetratricopeptide (TPR) repeat protein
MYKILCLLFVLTFSAQANELERLELANTLFEDAGKASLSDPDKSQKLYREAILNYRFLIEEKGYGSPDLFSNTGNACFFAGETGMAIVYYQKALQLDPGNSDVRHNLLYVRSMVIDDLPESILDDVLAVVFFWHSWSVTTRTALLGVVHLLFWVILSLLLFEKRKVLKRASVVSMALSLILAISLLLSLTGFDNNVDGVITENEIIARQGNGHIYEPAFLAPLHTGTEFAILETRDNWLYVELLDGSHCWLPKQSVTFIN